MAKEPKYPPYMLRPNNLDRIFTKIKEAKTPDVFSHDFLENTLMIKGGFYKAFIPFSKRIGLLNSDGSPTDLYKKFRNPDSSKYAIAQIMYNAYQDVFDVNVKAHELPSEKLKGLVMEITGLEKNSTSLISIVKTFEKLKQYADFNAIDSTAKDANDEPDSTDIHDDTQSSDSKLNLSYQFNLILPKTTDVAVYNAIFRSLKDNLLK